MRYLILTKLEYPASISLKVKGLNREEIDAIGKIFDKRKIKYSTSDPSFLEVDLSGIDMLNMLAEDKFGYKVVSQSMAMEHAYLGGRSFQIEKVIWTLETSS